MNLLNLYFTPFATGLVLLALYFNYQDMDRKTKVLAFTVLGLSLLVNHWFARNTYRFVGWTSRFKTIQVWLTFLWSAPLFYLLVGFWAPMWLLFAMPPVTAALYQGRWQTLGVSAASAGAMLGLYYARSTALGLELGAVAWGMAFTHAAFILVLGLFVHSLAQAALRLRDLALRPPHS